MSRIVAIGGGEIGRPGYKLETLEIDEYIVNICGISRPALTFFPTATHDSKIYVDAINRLYRDRLQCSVRVIELTKKSYDREDISSAVLSSDIVYVGGGDTEFMLATWRQNEVDAIFRKALSSNIIFSGLSAGAVCWFNYAYSDSVTIDDEKQNGLLSCLGMVPGTVCPHYQDIERKTAFCEMLKKQNMIGIGIENFAAVSIADGYYEIVCSDDSASAYIVNGQSEEIVETPLKSGDTGEIAMFEGAAT